jgi:hypothetical protein
MSQNGGGSTREAASQSSVDSGQHTRAAHLRVLGFLRQRGLDDQMIDFVVRLLETVAVFYLGDDRPASCHPRRPVFGSR